MPSRPPARYVHILILSITLLLVMSACAHYRNRPYWANYRQPEIDPKFDLFFVESNDRGWFWERKEAVGALTAVQDSLNKQNTLVLLFAPGWRHSAQSDDDSVKDFRTLLGKLKDELEKPVYKRARAFMHNDPDKLLDVKVIGVYLGWRGQSLPGLLSYLTFWGRKATAERVGESDFQEFLIRMRAIYEHQILAALTSPPPAPSTTPLPSPPYILGMVTVGHSFGGQAVLKATSSFLEHQMVDLGATPAFDGKAGGKMLGEPLKTPLPGFGDLIILVNPAVESAAYQRINNLSQSLKYSPTQTPVMLTLSATNDWPRHTLFKWGREAEDFFGVHAPIRDEQELAMERKALGFYDEQVTHELLAVADEAGNYKSGQDTLTAECTDAALTKIRNHDFSSETQFGDVILRRKPGVATNPAFIVAAATPRVIPDHDGIFLNGLTTFLIKYIVFTEGKKLLLPVAAVPKGLCVQYLNSPPGI